MQLELELAVHRSKHGERLHGEHQHEHSVAARRAAVLLELAEVDLAHIEGEGEANATMRSQANQIEQGILSKMMSVKSLK